MLCQSFDKEQPCKEDATMTVFWPGKTTESCERHYQGQLRIAGFMGFALDARPIPMPSEGTKVD